MLRNHQKEQMKNTDDKNKVNKRISPKRLIVIMFIITLVLVLLLTRVGYLQFVEGEELKAHANSQTTSSTLISASRGMILDRQGRTLAVSADVDTISVNPAYIQVLNGQKVEEEKTKELKENMAKKMAEIFELDEAAVLEKLNSSNSVETIVSKVEKDKVKLLEDWLKENKATAGVNIDEDTKRYYPFNNLASNVIGFCGASGQGLDGIELSFDDVLSGKNGKITTSVSVVHDQIPSSDQEYIEPQNGSNVYLTIDSNIQLIAEKYLKQACDANSCRNGGNCLIMDPETGDILAMATYPDYNLNTPYTPNDYYAENWGNMSSEARTEALYKMWRNRAVLDAYEPGSTFKVITASIALEEDLIETDTPGVFYCDGDQQVYEKNIRCTGVHGTQSLRDAMRNSCNPALIQLSQKIGVKTFYKYLKAYGLLDETGVDLPSEGYSTFWKEENAGPVELATLSFGQRFAITPLQLVTAVSAIANGGTLVKPRICYKVNNTNTGVTTETPVEKRTRVISEETANLVKDMMKSVVEDGSGRNAKVEGYEIAGKTGTSEPRAGHEEEGYVVSFVSIAPVTYSKVTCLVTLYGPRGANIYGSTLAAPVVGSILSEVLPYLDSKED